MSAGLLLLLPACVLSAHASFDASSPFTARSRTTDPASSMSCRHGSPVDRAVEPPSQGSLRRVQPHQILLRHRNGCSLSWLSSQISGVNAKLHPEDQTSPLMQMDEFESAGTSQDCKVVYSKDGRRLVQMVQDSVLVHDPSTGQVEYDCRSEDGDAIQGVALSPKGDFLVTFTKWFQGASKSKRWRAYNRATQVERVMETSGNLVIWHIPTCNIMVDCDSEDLFDPDHWPSIQWTADDEICCRRTIRGIEVYNWNAVQLRQIPSGVKVEPHMVIKMKEVRQLMLASAFGTAVTDGRSRRAVNIAVFHAEKGREEVFIYSLTEDFEVDAPSMTIDLLGTEDVSFKWSYDGQCLLILCSTTVDKTNNNYYGTTTLKYVNMDLMTSADVQLDRDGPIHDLAWSPCTREFIVVYGMMPAKACLFNNKGQAIFSFGTGPFNSITWSPHGRFLCIGGFGNLAGHMQFWDKMQRQKIGQATARCSIYRSFSPCSRYFMTAVTFPGLRIDNEVCLWKYDGTLLYQLKDFHELYQAEWRPYDARGFGDRSISPDVVQKLKTAQAADAVKFPQVVDGRDIKQSFQPFRRASFGLHDTPDAKKEEAGVVEGTQVNLKPRGGRYASIDEVQEQEDLPFGSAPVLSKSQMKRLKRKGKLPRD